MWCRFNGLLAADNMRQEVLSLAEECSEDIKQVLVLSHKQEVYLLGRSQCIMTMSHCLLSQRHAVHSQGGLAIHTFVCSLSHWLHTSCNSMLIRRLRASAGGAQACKHIHREQGEPAE